MAPNRSIALDATPPEIRDVRLYVEGAVVTLQLGRLQSLNALDASLVEDLVAAVRWCESREDLGCLVVTGAGKGFCAGGDLAMLHHGAANPDELEATVGQLAGRLNVAIAALHTMNCPVVAAVNGRAAGAGLSLALACDIRIASERAVFDFAYARVGATPDGGMTWFLPRILGLSRATELLLQSPILRSERALGLGLVSAVVPAHRLRHQARSLARRLARQPSHYPGTVKSLAREGAETGLAAHLEVERAALLESLRTEDARLCLGKLGQRAGLQEHGLVDDL